MRDLIRPAMFSVARLGSALSITAWLTSQWWSVSTLWEFHGPTRFFGAYDEGWCAGRVRSGYLGDGVLFHVRGTGMPLDEQQTSPEISWCVRSRESLAPGIAVSECRPNNSRYITVDYWLVVTICALFYGVLKWLYRKQGREAMADE